MTALAYQPRDPGPAYRGTPFADAQDFSEYLAGAICDVQDALPGLRAEHDDPDDLASALDDCATTALHEAARAASRDLSDWRTEVEVEPCDIGSVADVLAGVGL